MIMDRADQILKMALLSLKRCSHWTGPPQIVHWVAFLMHIQLILFVFLTRISKRGGTSTPYKYWNKDDWSQLLWGKTLSASSATD